jgi:manganese transport protein
MQGGSLFPQAKSETPYDLNVPEFMNPEPKENVLAPESGWRSSSPTVSLSESHGSIAVPKGAGFWRKALAFSGPGYLVAVGYMDPGNWATDLAGGSKFGYTLLSVVLLSSLMAILLQSLAAKLGIVTGRDLAQACRDHYPPRALIPQWLLCELAICACDLAEVIGSAIALNLLFKLPLVWGVCLTALDVVAILFLEKKGFRALEALVFVLILSIGGCFLIEIFLSRPDLPAVLRGFVPQLEIVRNPEMLYLAIGIVGATVMPHNLYLHSSIVQTRKYEQTDEGKQEAIRYATLDSVVALTSALFINAGILIVAAATFHVRGVYQVAEIQDAHKLLSPMLGATIASTAFAVALLASGQNSTLTGTLAGQIVMEGFINLRIRPWLRRLITRLIAIVPAVIVIARYGDRGTGPLIILSQVVLSLQLPFAVFPLVMFTSDPHKMGEFANALWVKLLAYAVAVIIAALNIYMLFQIFTVH